MTASVAHEHHATDVKLQHALVLDHDHDVVERVTDALRRHGHEVHTIEGRDEAWNCLAEDRPDLLVVACRQPHDITRVRRLRGEYQGPIVCYSTAAPARDRIELLALGVDDVVPSPLSYEELALRVQAVARRTDARRDAECDTITCGAITADRGTHQVRLRGEWVQLTAVEFSLLAFLMRNARTAFTRRELLRRVWGYEIGDTSTVSVHIRRLRRKLELDATRPALIRTVWGSGYYFDPDAE